MTKQNDGRTRWGDDDKLDHERTLADIHGPWARKHYKDAHLQVFREWQRQEKETLRQVRQREEALRKVRAGDRLEEFHYQEALKLSLGEAAEIDNGEVPPPPPVPAQPRRPQAHSAQKMNPANLFCFDELEGMMDPLMEIRDDGLLAWRAGPAPHRADGLDPKAKCCGTCRGKCGWFFSGKHGCVFGADCTYCHDFRHSGRTRR